MIRKCKVAEGDKALPCNRARTQILLLCLLQRHYTPFPRLGCSVVACVVSVFHNGIISPIGPDKSLQTKCLSIRFSPRANKKHENSKNNLRFMDFKQSTLNTHLKCHF